LFFYLLIVVYLFPKVSLELLFSSHFFKLFVTLYLIEKQLFLLLLQSFLTSFAILNFDNEIVMKMKEQTRARVITFGFNDGADLKISSFENRNTQINTDYTQTNTEITQHYNSPDTTKTLQPSTTSKEQGKWH